MGALRKMIFTICWVTLCTTFLGCKVSLSGIAIPEAANSVSVELFDNGAALTNPAFPQQFTEALRDKFLRETRLRVMPQGGDLGFTGRITGYSIVPVAVGGNETAALTRLTVSISVEYNNTLQPEKNFTKTFSRFADFDSTQPLSAVESGLLDDISRQLVQDIFNQAFLDW
jgi:hypothetical protein